ncbi:MAG: T9SS type A sorting domain-containing protein [Bacteroidales bacterium]|jgi:hypothetical protein
MKKYLLNMFLLCASIGLLHGQTEIIIDDFTGNTSSGLGTATGNDDPEGAGSSVITYENDQLKSDYSWIHSDWFPRAVWYEFDEYQDLSELPIMVMRFMVTDEFNDEINLRFDLYGNGVGDWSDSVQMETNGNPWELVAENGEWYTDTTNYLTNNRYFCTYYYGDIEPQRVDSTRINGFEAFASYGDGAYDNQAGTLFIDFIKMVDEYGEPSATEEVIYGRENAFGLALYPNPASSMLNVNSENEIARIDVFDITGKPVQTLSYANRIKKDKIDVSSFRSGVYLVAVRDTDGNIVTQKIRVNTAN